MTDDSFSIEKLLSQKFEIPELKNPENEQELLEQINTISEITSRCEKILSHLILSEGFDSKTVTDYIATHVQLIGMKNKLRKMQIEMNRAADEEDTGVDSGQTLDSFEKS